MASNAVATRAESGPPEIVKFRNQLEQRANEFAMALPSHISPEKFQRTILTAVQSDPDLLKADRQSLIIACMKAAQDCLLPDKREAALVVFKVNKKDAQGAWQTSMLVQYLPMVYGLRKKILQSGEVADITARVVYRKEVAAGHFVYEEGSARTLRHRPMLDLTEADTADSEIVAAYSMATMKDGTHSYEVMRRFEIDKVREASQTGATRTKKGEPRTASGPWVDWFPEQAKKTVMRRHSKVLPMSGDLIDVEANEQRAAESAMAVLAAPTAAPVIAAPTREQFIAGSGAQVIEHDTSTGEIIESTTRELDSALNNALDKPESTPNPAKKGRNRPPEASEVDAPPPNTDAAADGSSPRSGDNDEQKPARSALFETISAKIASETTILRIVEARDSLPSELGPDEANALEDQANARIAALRAGADSGAK